MIRENRTKRILMEGGTVCGVFMDFVDPAVFEVLGRSGIDFVVIDDEHFHHSESELRNIFLASESRGIETTPLIRIRDGEIGTIKRSLDMGAMGIQVPMVDTYDQAKSIIDAAYYPPKGHRGFGSGQHSIGYGFIDRMEYVKIANSEILNVLQCETVESVKNLDNILSIPEVDVVFVGATDLSCSMGPDVMLQSDNPELLRIIDMAIEKIVKTGKIAGVAVRGAKQIKKYREKGARYFLVGNDLGFVKKGAKETVEMCKEALAEF